MTKIVRLGIAPLELIKEGVNTLAGAVKVTLGPNGRTVILHRGFGSPHVTKDGVTVSKDVEFEDSVTNMASTLVKQVARKTAEEAGDGTTTSITLINSMFNNAYKHLIKERGFFGNKITKRFSKVNPMELTSGMKLAVADTVDCLVKISHKIQTSEELKNIAMISSNGDKSMGDLLYKVYKELGNSVKITRDPNPSTKDKDQVSINTGYNFDRGFCSPSFANEEEGTTCELENPIFGLFSGVLKNFDDIIPFLEISFVIKRPLVIIADEFDPKILDALVKNNLNPKSSSILAIKTPGMGANKGYNLEDIAAVINYKVEPSSDLSKIKEEHLGSCKTIISTSSETNIILHKSGNESLSSHLSYLKASIKEETSDYTKELFETRASKLQGKVAVISLHAKTEGELLERIDRLDDAIEATKSALEEGYIAGGGLPLFRISEILNTRLQFKNLKKDQLKGYKAVLDALKEPFRTILINGALDPSIIYNRIPNKFQSYKLGPTNNYYTVGYNSRSGQYENMIDKGVIDPVKVTRIALESAVSTSSVLLTTGCTISLN